jgi:hypothetical protein
MRKRPERQPEVAQRDVEVRPYQQQVGDQRDSRVCGRREMT